MPVDPESIADTLPSRCEFLYVWTSLGDPPDRSFDIPEFFEPDRRNFNGSTLGVNVSAPRAVENFLDLIGLFVQSVTEEQVRAHMFLSLVDDESSIAQIRFFVQTIFAQDMPILENQHPKSLPLDPRAETPIRSDQAAIVYRRWLSDLGVTYGVIPAA